MITLKHFVQIIFVVCFSVNSCISNEDLTTNNTKESDLKVVFSTDFIDNADSYLFSNGYALSVFNDNTDGYKLFIDSLDFELNMWVKEKSMAIYCDSSLKPFIVTDCNGCIFEFTYSQDGMFDLKVIDIDDSVNTYENIPISYDSSSSITKSSPDYFKDLDNTLNIVNIAMSVSDRKELITELVSDFFTDKVIPDGLPNSFADLGLSSIGAYFNKNAMGYAGLALSYFELLDDVIDWRLQELIGCIEPFISSVSMSDNHNVDVRINFRGNFQEGQNEIAYYHINYWKEVGGKQVGKIYRTSPQEVGYGFTTETVPMTSGGTYAFKVVVYPVSFVNSYFMSNNYSYSSNIYRFDVPPIYINNLKIINEDLIYNGEYLETEIAIELEFLSDTDENILSNYSEYGIYGVNSDGSKSFFSVQDNVGLGFILTLRLLKEDFNIDYNIFKAICDKTKIGVYVKDNYGIINYYNEQPIEVVYDKKPSILISNFAQGITVPYYDEDGRDLKTYVDIEFNITGALFIDAIFEYNVGTFDFEGMLVRNNLDFTLSDNNIYNYTNSYNYFSSYDEDIDPAYTYYGVSVNGNDILSSKYVCCNWMNGTFYLLGGAMQQKSFFSCYAYFIIQAFKCQYGKFLHALQ